MLSKSITDAMKTNSVIRAMFNEGKEMAEKIGAENVYDFSLGNPATPAPAKVNEAIKAAVDGLDSMELHGYMSNSGYPDVRQAVADSLNKRFGTDFDFHNIIMTVGAAGGLNIVLKALLDPGDEVIAFAPYFGEYRGYAANFGGSIVEVAPNLADFQPDLIDFEKKITEKTKAAIINTPNNPTGVIYSDATMQKIGEILSEKEKEYGHEIYLISDEPYRELVYDGAPVRFLTGFYHNTIVGYSFSKSLSLPGERIGYVVVPNEVRDADDVLTGIEIANRQLGFVNAPSLMQKAVAQCLDEETDVAYYDKNRELLYGELTEMGFTCIKPQGAFYLWVKSPVPDEEEFVQAAKKYHILFVKGSAFACPGYVRIAYCVSAEKIEKSLPAFEKLAADFEL